MVGKNDRVTWLELDGAVNVRDLGGLPAADGRQVVAGRLLRGDDLKIGHDRQVDLLLSGLLAAEHFLETETLAAAEA